MSPPEPTSTITTKCIPTDKNQKMQSNQHNILVTGANGQLGSELRLVAPTDPDHNYYYTDVAELDITDKSAVTKFMNTHQISTVVNCAAYTNVDKAEDDIDMADLINHLAVRNLAETCFEQNALLIHISTDYVFDGTHNNPYSETDPTHPLGIYGITKRKGEEVVLQSGCNHIILRTSWLYSAFGKNFVKTMQKLTGEKEVLRVVFDQVGTPTYAHDLANIIISIIQKGAFSGINQIYHFSNEGVCSWYDFAVAINESFGHTCNVQPCHSSEYPSKVARPSYSVLDKTKIKDALGIEIPHWRTSLSRCVERLRTD